MIDQRTDLAVRKSVTVEAPQERAFAQGKGPDPATQDHISAGFLLEQDPLR